MKTFKSKVLISSILFLGMLLSPSISSASTDFRIGINGHPMVQEAYISSGVSTQFQILKKLGAKIYRVDFSTAADGVVHAPVIFDQLRIAAAQNGIELLPMLSAWSINYNLDETANYNLGKTVGTNFAHNYGQYFDHYELGNEEDNGVLLTGPYVTGAKLADYDLVKLSRVAAFLKGMNDGIKSQDPTAQTMIDASWVHYAYLQYMENYGVTFDIIAYHWYSNMEKLAPKLTTPIPDITKKLSSLFTKPIWFTEVGQIYNATNTNMAGDQNTFLTAFIAKAQSNPQVKAVLFYEMFDEPALKAQEANFGLVKWTTPYKTYTNKPFADTLVSLASTTSTAPVPTCLINSFSASPTAINAGGSSTLSWDTSNCGSLSISSIGTALASSGTRIITPTVSTTYTLTTPDGLTYNATVAVAANSPDCSINSFTASPTNITTGGSTTLSWDTANCAGVSISGVDENLPASGTRSVTPTTTTTYLLTTPNNLTSSAVVTVTNPVVVVPDPAPVAPVVFSGGGGGGGGSSFSPTPQSSSSTSSAHTLAAAYLPGECLSGEQFSRFSGKQCLSVNTGMTATMPATAYLPGECLPGAQFSNVSGLRCARASSTSVTVPVTTTGSATHIILTKDLRFKMDDIEVKLLQQYLNSRGYIVASSGAGSPGNENTIFGPKTKKALNAFQLASGLSAGYVGPLTRAYINTH